jgi:ribonuclease J
MPRGAMTTRVVRKDSPMPVELPKTDAPRQRSVPFSPERGLTQDRSPRLAQPIRKDHGHSRPQRQFRGGRDMQRNHRRDVRPNHRPDHSHPRGEHKPQDKPESSPITLNIPPAGESIRIIPLGGVEEIGKNMTAIEWKNDIIIVDIGLAFKDEDTPGIDYILPNTKYLEERKDKIRAVIITHGHLDHIGGVPYVMPRLGNPPLYTRNLTALMIKKRQSEFPHLPPIDFKIVERDETITLGEMKIKFFGVTHSIPDCLGVCLKTPWGNVINPGDYKLEHTDGVPSEGEEKVYGELAKEPTLLLMTDSTNIENPGFSIPEKQVHKNIEEIIKNVQGRLIIATFSSLLERLLRIIDFAELYGKKVVVEGRSMKSNIEICKHLGLLKAKNETIISSDEIENYPPDRIVILATGAQGDEFAAMMRMSNKTHAKIRITPRDTIMLSSSVIPGNERAVQKLKDNLSRQGAKIIHYRIADVHSSGHANRDETAWIHKKIHPKFFIPLHGYHYMLRVHGEIAKEANGLKLSF